MAWLPAEHVLERRSGRAGRRGRSADGRPVAGPPRPRPLAARRCAGARRSTCAVARARHGDRRLPARPGRDPLRHRRPAGALHRRLACPSDGRAVGPARLRRRGGRRRRRCAARRGARRQPPRAGRSWPRSTRRAWPRSTRRDREPARAGAGPHGGRRRRRRRGRARAAQRPPDGGVHAPGRRAASRSSGRDVQPQLARRSCARSSSTSAASPQKQTKTGLLHRRRHAREAARPVARVHRPAAAVPRGREAALDLRRGPAGRGRARRAHPRHVQPDGGPHRPAVVRPAEPAQHPGALRRGPAVPPGVRRRARAARCSSPTTTRSSCAASPTSPRTRASSRRSPSGQDIHNATASRVFGVEPGDVTIEQRSKAKMVSLRPGLRHGGLRARPAAQHPDRGGRRDPRRLLRRRSRT